MSFIEMNQDEAGVLSRPVVFILAVIICWVMLPVILLLVAVICAIVPVVALINPKIIKITKNKEHKK